MTPVRTALVALCMLTAWTPAGAQQPADPPPGEPAADQGVPPAEPRDRPKRGKLLDVLRAVVPPLIESASHPPPVQDPAPYQAPPPVVPQPAPQALPVKPTAVVAPAPPPRPVQVRPAPSAPRPRPTVAAADPTPPVSRPAPPRSDPMVAEAPLPAPSLPVPTVVGKPPPPPAIAAPPESPPAALDTAAMARGGIRWLPLILFAVAAIVAAAGLARLLRLRQIALTRAMLSLSPRLDPADGTSSISGLSLAAPPFSIRARLAPAGHG